MKKNTRIAKELVRLARMLVAGNPDEEFADSTFNKIQGMPDQEFIDAMIEFVQSAKAYLTNAQSTAQVVYNKTSSMMQRLNTVQDYIDNPTFLNTTTLMGEWGEKGLEPLRAIRQLQRRNAENTKLQGLIVPALHRINRTAQLCVSGRATQADISFLDSLIKALKGENAQLVFRQTQGTGTTDSAELTTDSFVRQVLKGVKDIKIRLAGLNKRMVENKKNLRMGIIVTELDDEAEKIGEQVIACNSITNVSLDDNIISDRKELGLPEIPKAISWKDKEKRTQKQQQALPSANVTQDAIGQLDSSLSKISSVRRRRAGIFSSVGEWFSEKWDQIVEAFKSVYEKLKSFYNRLTGVEQDIKEVADLNEDLYSFIDELKQAAGE